MAEPRIVIRGAPIAERLRARAGRGAGRSAGEDQERGGVGGRQFDAGARVLDVEGRLAALEIEQRPRFVGPQVLGTEQDGVSRYDDGVAQS